MKDILDRIADSSPNESSDELICRLRDCAHEIEALRAALASRPNAQADEPIAYEFQHDETGRTMFVDPWQVEQGFATNNPRWQLIGPVFRHARAAAPQAEAAQGVQQGEYKRMFEDTIRSLAAIDEALGIDPEEAGGAEPILEAIEGLQAALRLARETFFMNRIDVPRVFEKIDEALAVPSPDREQVGEATEAARIVKMWDDGFTQLAGSRAIDFLRDNASPSRECGEPPAENAGVRNKIAAALHYPDHWDTAAYPTLDDAAWEAIAAAKLTCSECGERQWATLSDSQILEIGYRHFKPGHNVKAETNFVAAVRDILAASAPTLGEQPQIAEPKGMTEKQRKPSVGWKTWGENNDCCDHCCNGDRCDDPSHIPRRNCPYCLGTGDALWMLPQYASAKGE